MRVNPRVTDATLVGVPGEPRYTAHLRTHSCPDADSSEAARPERAWRIAAVTLLIVATGAATPIGFT